MAARERNSCTWIVPSDNIPKPHRRGNTDRHEVGRRLDNRVGNSHQPFRRREPCSVFEAQRHCRNSIQFTRRSTTNSLRSGISPQEYKQTRFAGLASGGRFWRRQPPAGGRVAPSAHRCCTDKPVPLVVRRCLTRTRYARGCLSRVDPGRRPPKRNALFAANRQAALRRHIPQHLRLLRASQ